MHQHFSLLAAVVIISLEKNKFPVFVSQAMPVVCNVCLQIGIELCVGVVRVKLVCRDRIAIGGLEMVCLSAE